ADPDPAAAGDRRPDGAVRAQQRRHLRAGQQAHRARPVRDRQRLRGDAARRRHGGRPRARRRARHRPGALRAGRRLHGRHVQLLPALPRGRPPLHRARPHRRDPRGGAGQPGARPAV
ncbi:MAG: Membrane protein Rv3632, enhances catalytic activity of PpgS, partial [uncultured Pseudonocardia sp.]